MAKHIPQRTCIGCRQVQSKRELMRIVRTPEGRVVADPKGKLNGRGTYIHKQRECWDEVVSARGKLTHALKLESPIAPDDLAALLELAKTFPPREAEGKPMNAQITVQRRPAPQAALKPGRK